MVCERMGRIDPERATGAIENIAYAFRQVTEALSEMWSAQAQSDLARIQAERQTPVVVQQTTPNLLPMIAVGSTVVLGVLLLSRR